MPSLLVCLFICSAVRLLIVDISYQLYGRCHSKLFLCPQLSIFPLQLFRHFPSNSFLAKIFDSFYYCAHLAQTLNVAFIAFYSHIRFTKVQKIVCSVMSTSAIYYTRWLSSALILGVLFTSYAPQKNCSNFPLDWRRTQKVLRVAHNK